MGLKVFGPGGIDQKSNDLLRDPKDLRDSLNVVLSDRGEYEKREGTDQDTNFSGDTYNDVVYIKSLKEYFFRNGSTYYSYKNNVKKSIHKFVDPTTVPTSNISSDEYLNTLVFTHHEGQVATCSYDGSSVYRAGLPAPKTTPSGSGSNYFLLSFFEFIDAKGNIVFGPATINENAPSGSFSLTFDTLAKEGFCAAFLRASVSTAPIVLNSTSRTITYDTKSDDIVVGGSVVFRSRGTSIVISDLASPSRSFNSDFIVLEVESVDTGAKTITFTAASFKTKNISIQLTSGGPVIANVHGGCVLRTMFSLERTTEYTTLQSSLNGVLVDNSAVTQTATISFDNSVHDILLSDFYDIGTSKIRPPNCTYITAFGNQLVCGLVLSFYDFENKETIYANNDLIMYSDVSTGDLGFNFSEINRQLIGQTYDGQISGMVRYIDSVIVFKDRGIYSIDGILIPGQYSLRKILSNEIGCLSDKSILVSDSIVIFQGHDGLYVTNGYKCMAFSDTIYKFFENVDPAQTRSVMYNKNDMYLFFTDQGVVAFDFEFQKFFIWSFIDASKGLTVDETGSVRMFDSSIARKFISDKKDFNKPWIANNLLDKYLLIDGYIESAWFDQKEPSLLKKVTGLRLFSLNNLGQTLTAQIFHDWDEAKLKAPITIAMPIAIKSIEKKIDIQQAQSFSFKIRNNIINEDMNLSGYEVTTSLIQGLDKND